MGWKEGLQGERLALRNSRFLEKEAGFEEWQIPGHGEGGGFWGIADSWRRRRVLRNSRFLEKEAGFGGIADS